MSSDPAPNNFLKRIGKALSISHANDNKRDSNDSLPPAAPSAPDERVAISISINGRNGLSDELLFQDGDDPDTVARAFVAKHGLPPAAVPKLVSLIERQWQENVIGRNLLPTRPAPQDPIVTPPRKDTAEPSNSQFSPPDVYDDPRQYVPPVESPDSGREVLSEETPVDEPQEQQTPQQRPYTSLLSQSKHFRGNSAQGQAVDASRADGGAVSFGGRGRGGEVSPASPSRIEDATIDASFAHPGHHAPQEAGGYDDGEAGVYDNARRQWEKRPSSGRGSSDASRGTAPPPRQPMEGDFDAMPVSGRASVSSMGSNRKQSLRGDGDSAVSKATSKQNMTCYDRLYHEAEMRWARQERRRDAGITAVFEANFKT
jgi:hypothetical protein